MGIRPADKQTRKRLRHMHKLDTHKHTRSVHRLSSKLLRRFAIHFIITKVLRSIYHLTSSIPLFSSKR